MCNSNNSLHSTLFVCLLLKLFIIPDKLGHQEKVIRNGIIHITYLSTMPKDSLSLDYNLKMYTVSIILLSLENHYTKNTI